ncbi:MAG: hypothetical protein R3F29_05165 [Planctomycetota bacterium]
MNRSFRLGLVAALLAVPTLAQSAAQLKKELRTKERVAKNDPEQIFEVGKWAKQHSLAADAKRLFEKVLKLQPDHAGAHEALGFELVDGKWIPAAEAEAARRKKWAEEYAAKGFVEVDGIWVEPDNVEDAMKGIFHHDDEVVSRAEKAALLEGKLRHPQLGTLYDPKFKDKVDAGYYQVGEDKWVDLKEADSFHSELTRPWAIRSAYATLLSTMPLEKLLELKLQANIGQEAVAPLFGGRVAPPDRRPVIIVARTQSEYVTYGTDLGDGTDVAGAFVIREEARVQVPYQKEVRAAICDNDKDWGTRYLRHAAAIAYAQSIADADGVELPLWFLHGIGGYTSRFGNDGDASWFGKQQLQKGGLTNFKSFFSSFALEQDTVGASIYQAGLMFAYATRGGDPAVTAAMEKVSEALSGKGGTKAAIDNLEKALIQAQAGVEKFLNELASK